MTTAAEFDSEKSADSGYREMQAALDVQARAIEEQFERDSAALTNELAEHGYIVDAVWKLPSRYPDYTEALPILAKHLVMDYPDNVVDAIARRLAIRGAVGWWGTVKERYANAPGTQSKQGLAVALCQMAGKPQVEELMGLADDPANGESRVLFLRTIKRLGGPSGLEFITNRAQDPVLGQESQRVLARKAPND